MRVLVLTCAHPGDDARIVHRQARALLEHGHEVVLVAPAVASTDLDPPGLERCVVPRAVGTSRVGPWRAVRREVGGLAPGCDIAIVHDPELLPVVLGRIPSPVVWDVHEDFGASVADRAWIPRPARPLASAVVASIEAVARRRCHLVVAEAAYRDRLGDVPLVPNSTWVPDAPPPPSDDERPRLVYVGRLSAGRGVAELVELGRRLGGDCEVCLVGAADRDVADVVTAATERGDVRWLGPLPNPQALEIVDGALLGLSLLHDEPNYRHSQPTKILEYMARGVPVVTTPLPLARKVVERSGAGVVVPFGDADAVVGAVVDAVAQVRSADRREVMGRLGHAYVAEHHNWAIDGARFVEQLEQWAGACSLVRPAGRPL